MRYKIIYTDKAISDLKQIASYIITQSGSKETSKKFITKVLDQINSLSLFPFSGSRPKSKHLYKTNYRYIIEGEYLIFYRVRETDVIIESVFHSKKDYYRFLIESVTDIE